MYTQYGLYVNTDDTKWMDGWVNGWTSLDEQTVHLLYMCIHV